MDILHNTDFYQELSDMSYLKRCIVLGLVMHEEPKTIYRVLRISKKEFEDICKRDNLKARWKFYESLLDS
jgi:hypothetical protein